MTIYRPLQFWFNYQYRDPFTYSFTMPELTPDNLEAIKAGITQIVELRHQYCVHCHNPQVAVQQQFLETELMALNNYWQELECPNFNSPITLLDNVNGYELSRYFKEGGSLSYELYKQFDDVWDNGKAKDIDEFYEAMTFCSEWSKVDYNGDYNCSKIDNILWDNVERLYKLPYSTDAIALGVKVSCNAFEDNVRYVNSICHWVDVCRKSN